LAAAAARVRAEANALVIIASSSSAASSFVNSAKASRMRVMDVLDTASFPSARISEKHTFKVRAGRCGGANATRAIHSMLSLPFERQRFFSRNSSSARSRRRF
jgi:hypothetical protein